MSAAILIALAVVIGLLIHLASRLAKEAPDRAELARLRTREEDYQAVSEALKQKSTAVEDLKAECARLEVALDHEKQSSTEKLKLLDDAREVLNKEFENTAHRIFENKGKVLAEHNRERISGLLQPFRDQLDSFRKRVDEVHRDGTAQSAKLLEQVRQLQELSNKVSDEANNLAKAIKGDSKQQGDWGELIVERIFEASGLEKGREYEVQKGLRDADGTLRRPDFVLNLPDGKVVIVDSKVSLTAYERFCSADNDADRAAELEKHVKSVRNHVDELNTKNYSDLLGNRTLDFVIMCVPVEWAYQSALQADENFIYDLSRTNVVVTGPTTLMMVLKLISQIWRRERENRHAEEIAERAGKMYNQVRLVADSMQEAQKRLGGVSESFETAMMRLSEGKGNLVSRVEGMRKLGAKVKQQIDPALVETALAHEDPDEDAGLLPEPDNEPDAETEIRKLQAG